MIGKRFRSLPFIFANDNYTLSSASILQMPLFTSFHYFFIAVNQTFIALHDLSRVSIQVFYTHSRGTKCRQQTPVE